MKKLLLVAVVAMFLVGCAAAKQAVQDYKTGQETPLVNGEVSPKDQGAQIGNTVKDLPIPGAPAAGAAVTFLATLFFTWKRGQQIRKTGAPQATAESNAPHIVQDIANVAAGAFTLIKDNGGLTGSIIQRAWKVALASGISGAAVATADPAVGSFLAAHPIASVAFVAVTSALAGLEKGLSNVPAPAKATT